MKTEELIRVLVLDGTRPAMSIGRTLSVAALLGSALSALLFAAVLHPRPDLAQALSTPAFAFKVLLVLALVITAATVVVDVARPVPAARWRRSLLWVLALLAVGVVVELTLRPADTWLGRLIGHDAAHCLSLIPLLSLAPAACLLIALRRGAPARPGLAGAVAGLLAGGLGALLYAVSCPEDSPLFVATWYSIAIALVTGATAVTGRRLLRW
jgi:hypothetical protein